LTTKVIVVSDAVGKPLDIALLPGNACELDGADLLLPNIEADTVIADKGFDADARVREPLAIAGKTAVIPPKSNRKNPASYDKQLYRLRHRIENFFSRLKDYRGIATRYDKLARNYLAAIHLVAAVIWIN
jgi:transposase